MNQLNYAVEPNRLKLIWQSGGADRTKYTVGELVRAYDKVSLSYFRLSTDMFSAIASGFQGHPAFRIEMPVHHSNVMEVFSKRLPPRTRSDFASYLEKVGLARFPEISNFALLGYTGAYLPHDGFSFAIDFLYENLPFEFLMEISGFRYYGGMEIKLSTMITQFVHFQAEPTNKYDPNAVKIILGGTQIGYAPRYYSGLLAYWLQHCEVFGIIERIDGTMIKPQVYIRMHVLSRGLQQIT